MRHGGQQLGPDDEHPFSPFDAAGLPPVGETPFAVGAEQVLRGRYRLGERLRTGATGAVYRGSDIRTGRPVAIKILQWWDDDPTSMHRFRREADVIRRLAHPNIVQLLDFGQTEDEVLFLVLELLEGEDLAEVLHRVGPISDIDALTSMVAQLASALDAVHAAGIVHRDLKPTNVIVRGYPETPLLKLLDFGMSKLLDGASSVTGHNQVMGSMGYMSPEQVLGRSAEVDHRADLYALAAIVYRMLTGQPPFPHKTLAALSHAVLTEVVAPPSRLRPVPASIDAVFARALAKSPAQRFASADELLGALVAAWSGGEG